MECCDSLGFDYHRTELTPNTKLHNVKFDDGSVFQLPTESLSAAIVLQNHKHFTSAVARVQRNEATFSLGNHRSENATFLTLKLGINRENPSKQFNFAINKRLPQMSPLTQFFHTIISTWVLLLLLLTCYKAPFLSLIPSNQEKSVMHTIVHIGDLRVCNQTWTCHDTQWPRL